MNGQGSFYPNKAIHSIVLLVFVFSSFGTGNIAKIPMNRGTSAASLPYEVCDPDGVDIGAYVAADPPRAAAVRSFESLSGRHLCTVSWYEAWSASAQPSFPSAALTAALYHDGYDTHTIMQLSWEPWARLNAISAGTYDSYLRRYANQMKTWGHPIRLRLAYEMIQDDNYDNCSGQPSCPEWYPWQDQPIAYVAAFRHVHDVFTAVGASNVEFVWCANNYPFQMDIVKKYYPGSAYVDWLCMDGYNLGNRDGQPGWPDWQWFDDLFYNLYHTFVDNTSFYGDKPIMIGEVASCEASPHELAGQTKPAWITNMFQRLKSPDYAQVKAFYWFHINKECDWRINSSPQSLSAFRAAIADPPFSSHPTSTVTQLKSTGSQDGWVLETSENSNQGGGINAGAVTFLLGDTVTRRQYRVILSFNTSSLPDNAIITGVTLKIKKQSLTGTNPFTTHGKIAVDIRQGAFSNNAALQPSDFQAVASKPGVGLF